MHPSKSTIQFYRNLENRIENSQAIHSTLLRLTATTRSGFALSKNTKIQISNHVGNFLWRREPLNEIEFDKMFGVVVVEEKGLLLGEKPVLVNASER